jgi:Holliday junction resolvasome RuvABC endonuclease subunit
MFCDPGFGRFGWSILDVGFGEDCLVACGLIVTKRLNKKRAIYQVDDEVRRCIKIAREIDSIFEEHHPVLCGAEERQANSSWSRSSIAAVALAWGVLVGKCDGLGVPVLNVSVSDAKRAFARVNTASKKYVANRIDETIDTSMIDKTKKFDDYQSHIYDSIAVGFAVKDHPTIAALRSVHRAE